MNKIIYFFWFFLCTEFFFLNGINKEGKGKGNYITIIKEYDEEIKKIKKWSYGVLGITSLVSLILDAMQNYHSRKIFTNINKEMNLLNKNIVDLFNDSMQKNYKKSNLLYVKDLLDDIKGLYNQKQEFLDLIMLMNDYQNIKKMGIKIPKGFLLEGPPGTGKTMMARAFAGSMNIPFLYCAGSSFDEKYIGVGAQRMRDLFEEARSILFYFQDIKNKQTFINKDFQNEPFVIICIDELDTLSKRMDDSGSSYATLNELLVQLDINNKYDLNIIFIGITNLPERLDSALLRPGRIDRRIYFDLPYEEERMEIIDYYLFDKKYDQDDISVFSIAKKTADFSPADIENLINEAAIIAYKNGSMISMKDIWEAYDKIILGLKPNTTRVIEKNDLYETAVHESGHTLAMLFLEDYPFSFERVTILPQGRTLGVTHSIKDQVGEFHSYSKLEYEALIKVCLAGKAAEEILLKKTTAGVSVDLENATYYASNMICKFGMGTNLMYENKEISSEQKQEINLLLQKLYKETIDLLIDNKDKLKKIIEILLDQKTMTIEEIKYIF
jgi:ATP-dependent Zn protease